MKRSDLAGPPDEVARRLLGARLVVGDVEVRLVDLEGYGGADDAASHAYRGRTPRNRSMFGRPGLLYVYLSYGVHWCANVVCGEEGVASAVLLRGVRVTRGEELVAARRGGALRQGRLEGPGRVCAGLAVDRAFDGVDLLARGAPARLVGGGTVDHRAVAVGPRVGITKEAARPWRFRVVDRQPARPPRAASGRGPR